VTRKGFFQWVGLHRAGLITGVGYATAAVIAITIFVYLTFPWQQLSNWIRIRIGQNSGLEISVQKSRVHFPFRLDWTGVTVSQPGPVTRVLWTADEVSVAWPVGAILRRRLDLDFAMKGLGGEAHGRVTSRRTPQGMKYHLEATGKGFDLARLAAALRIPSQGVSGTVGFKRFEHDWMNQDVLQGLGVLELEVKEMELKSLETRFARITGKVTLKSGMGQLENFSAQGDALDLVGNGSLLLRPDFMESLLNFNSRVTLRKPTGPLVLLSAMASPDGHLDFVLRGALKHPTPYVNGTALGSIEVGSFGQLNSTGRNEEPLRPRGAPVRPGPRAMGR